MSLTNIIIHISINQYNNSMKIMAFKQYSNNLHIQLNTQQHCNVWKASGANPAPNLANVLNYEVFTKHRLDDICIFWAEPCAKLVLHD